MVTRLAVLAVAVAAFMLLPQAHAIELELAGIQLDQHAMDLMEQEPYGPPDFFGPAGLVTTWGITMVAPTTAGDAQPGARAPAAPSVGPAAPRAAPAIGRRARREEEDEEDELLRGQAVGSGAARPRAQPTAAGAEANIFWLYQMPGDTRIVVRLTAAGRVDAIVVSGRAYPPATTEGGVTLGHSYISVLDKYGFPDSTVNAGGALVLRYLNAGLTLTLVNMRVSTIVLAKPGLAAPTRAVPAARVPAAARAAQPRGSGVAPRAPTPARQFEFRRHRDEDEED